MHISICFPFYEHHSHMLMAMIRRKRNAAVEMRYVNNTLQLNCRSELSSDLLRNGDVLFLQVHKSHRFVWFILTCSLLIVTGLNSDPSRVAAPTASTHMYLCTYRIYTLLRT